MNGNLLSFDEAYEKLLGFVRPVREVESVDTMLACGRVLAAALHSTISQPTMDNSAMDGYALRAADVPVAGTRLAVSQRIPAGSVGHALLPGTAARIFTGAPPLPAGADTVVMQELCEHDGDHVVINTVPTLGEAVRRKGWDIGVGEEVLPTWRAPYAPGACARCLGGRRAAAGVSAPEGGGVLHRQ